MSRSLTVLLLSLAVAASASEERSPLRQAQALAGPDAAPAAPAVQARSLEARYWIVAPAADARERTAIANAGVSIEEVLPDRVGGIGSGSALRRLGRAGVVFTAKPLEQQFHPRDFPKEDSAFHNYKELEQELKALAESAPELVSLFSIGRSVQGRDLWALRLNAGAKGAAPSAKPGAIFLGTHHAREHLSTEVPLLVAKHLIENRAKPEIAALLASRDVTFIPMVNPDGVEHDLRGDSYHMHRKNLRENEDGSVGVDLNRNYGFGWGGGGASTDPDSDTYRGPSAFSEPESQAVKRFVESRKNARVLVSYHTFSELILYPWGHSDDEITDARALAAYRAMAAEMGKMTGYRPMQSSGLYIASGDTTDWSWGELGIFSFTFELTPKSMWSGGFYPGAEAIASTAAANLRPALYLIGLADDPYRAAGSPPLSAAGIPAAHGGR